MAAGHAGHVDDPATAPYVPAEQLVHVADPFAALKVPAMQLSHMPVTAL